MELKKCHECGIKKDLSFFENRKDSRDGKRHQCRDCRKEKWEEAYRKRAISDPLAFWKQRARSLNNATGRRRGVAGKVIQNSKPISAVALKEKYESYPRCHYCSVNLKKEDIVFDHATPLSRSGNHNITNIRIACNDCNNLKYQKTEIEFQEFVPEYLNRFLSANPEPS